MKKLHYLTSLLLAMLTVGCSAPEVAPVKVEPTRLSVSYLDDVQPILGKRCVSCHSCYNSPCQAKLSSYEGIDRGASKSPVYDALRLKAMDPTRLFIDAQTTRQWREKGFYSLTESSTSDELTNNSIMLHMLYEKKLRPEVVGAYSPEEDELFCPSNSEEMGEYLAEKPNHGMPYGLPAISDKEYSVLSQWLQQGARGPSLHEQKQLKLPSFQASAEIAKWERFFNKQDTKHRVTARYLYEHFYLAHWNFPDAPGEFFEVVRSKTPAPEPIQIIATLRPYDDPGVETFYYRLQKIHSTIVHKTHMVVTFDDDKLARIEALFINPEWTESPHDIDYEVKQSANPFLAYSQIPARSRYQFLLDNNHFIITTFIRGPVCRGQIALNVIHDHFWIMFQDPQFDVGVKDPGFLVRQADNLSMPIETSSQRVIRTFSDGYKDKFETYFDDKEKLYGELYPNGLGLESVWKGNKASDAPILTIYRHFNSASVSKGVVGELPRTLWMLDFSQLERIYYLLVAGYDVFGNVSHQTNIRRYFDFIRMEGEENFLSYMPKDKRLEIFKSWYTGVDEVQEYERLEISERTSAIYYSTAHPKSEFVEQVVTSHILKSTNIKFDSINYFSEGQFPPEMPAEFKTKEDILTGMRALTRPGTGFISHVTDNGVNVILLRIKMEEGEDIVGTLVVNRWHDNVYSMFNKEQSNPKKDTLDFVRGSIGSYPNVFANVPYADLSDFFDLLQNYDRSPEYDSKIAKYFVSRSDTQFWQSFDWFQNHFNESDPLGAGLYDLNRYFGRTW
jgi:hypothetical protein